MELTINTNIRIKKEVKTMVVPCKNCDRKGCGSYHDICEQYQSFRKERNERSLEKIREEMNRKPKRKWRYGENSPLKTHMR